MSSLDLSFKTAEGLKREVDAMKKKLKGASLLSCDTPIWLEACI